MPVNLWHLSLAVSIDCISAFISVLLVSVKMKTAFSSLFFFCFSPPVKASLLFRLHPLNSKSINMACARRFFLLSRFSSKWPARSLAATFLHLATRGYLCCGVNVAFQQNQTCTVITEHLSRLLTRDFAIAIHCGSFFTQAVSRS